MEFNLKLMCFPDKYQFKLNIIKSFQHENVIVDLLSLSIHLVYILLTSGSKSILILI